MNENYLERNNNWLLPLLVGLVLAAAPIMLEMVEIKNPIPAWVSLAVASIGFIISGIKAYFTDTFSAKIIRFLVGIFAIGMVVLMIYRMIY